MAICKKCLSKIGKFIFSPVFHPIFTPFTTWNIDKNRPNFQWGKTRFDGKRKILILSQKNKISGHFGIKIDVSHRKNDKFYMGKDEKLLQIDKKTQYFQRWSHNKPQQDICRCRKPVKQGDFIINFAKQNTSNFQWWKTRFFSGKI